ncbi:hypothetical protein [Rhizobium laguerreae]|uniref:hypothetical protein n=1 Tax=Rhizobium laguerreae TaxID=1076926 RepID=UPI00104C9824|nr:hypothetical protein [Rhizobium laguerreae]NNH83896.1 hypothetical protein [Rhizobium laguerreae]
MRVAMNKDCLTEAIADPAFEPEVDYGVPVLPQQQNKTIAGDIYRLNVPFQQKLPGCYRRDLISTALLPVSRD